MSGKKSQKQAAETAFAESISVKVPAPKRVVADTKPVATPVPDFGLVACVPFGLYTNGYGPDALVFVTKLADAIRARVFDAVPKGCVMSLVVNEYCVIASESTSWDHFALIRIDITDLVIPVTPTSTVNNVIVSIATAVDEALPPVPKRGSFNLYFCSNEGVSPTITTCDAHQLHVHLAASKLTSVVSSSGFRNCVVVSGRPDPDTGIILMPAVSIDRLTEVIPSDRVITIDTGTLNGQLPLSVERLFAFPSSDIWLPLPGSPC